MTRVECISDPFVVCIDGVINNLAFKVKLPLMKNSESLSILINLRELWLRWQVNLHLDQQDCGGVEITLIIVVLNCGNGGDMRMVMGVN